LFGEPPATDEAPAGGGMDDLFGEPPATDEAPAGGGMDDLFGEPPATDEAPAGGGMDDLFGEPPATDEAPAGDGMDDLFGTPTSSDESGDFDDLFGRTNGETDSDSVTRRASQNAGERLVVTEKQFPPHLSLQETSARVWIDNTSSFRTEGRLIEIYDGFVRLRKTNGKTCSVPMSRLCDADRAYVDSIKDQIESSRVAMLTSK